MVEKKWIAVIPARGGSKRIPKKNIINVFGKPMIEYTIKAAIESQIFNKVVVSTDDEETAEMSEKFGASVPFLRENNADDFAPVSLVTVDTLKILNSKFNENYDNVVQLMANCPLRNSNDIINAIENFKMTKSNFQISCFKYGWMNPWWAYKIDHKNNPKAIFPITYRFNRSQDLPQLYCPTGAIWIANVKKLLQEKTFYGKGYKLCPMNWKNALDVDDYDDLEMANYFIEKFK